MLTTKHQWDIFKKMNETAELIGFGFAIDEFDYEGLPDNHKGKPLLLMRKEPSGDVYAYHDLEHPEEIVTGMLHGILLFLSGMETYMVSEAEKIANQIVADAVKPTNQLENKNES